MIFGFGRKKKKQETEEEREVELVLFKGAVNGKEPNLKAHAKLARAGLMPAKQLVTDALNRRADMIRIDPRGSHALVTLLVDGVPQPGPRLPKPQAFAITQMLKLLAGMDVAVRDKPQSGGVRVELSEKQSVLWLETQPVQGAERLVIKVRDPSIDSKPVEELGMRDELKQKLRSLASGRSGILLVCGPPFSGTTTTSYTLLRSLDAFTNAIYTLCDTEGRDLPNISAGDWNEGETLADALKRLIRAEADVAFLGRINEEMFRTALELQSSITIIGEFPAKDAAHGIVQLIEWAGGDGAKVAEAVRGVMSQRLIRKLCPDCREAYKPNPQVLAKVGLPSDVKILYRKPAPPPPEVQQSDEYWPCETCGDVGFIGRIALFELIEMSDSVKQLISAGKPDPQAIRALARKENMWTFQKHGLQFVAEGLTSLEELKRVLTSGK